jgi:hypothetical protein
LKQSLKHIILFSSVAIVLTTALLLPTILKFEHAFEHHQHETCENPQVLHFHEAKFDCDLCDFQLTQTYYLEYLNYDFVEQNIVKKTFSELYNFKYYHQHLSFSLRGPPELLTRI